MLLALTSLFGVGLQVATTTSASAAEVPVAIIHHNIGGGQSPMQGDDTALNGVTAAINEFPWVTAVTLNEVCASQREEFKQRHPRWTVYWAKTKDKGAACTSGAEPNNLANVPAGEQDDYGEMIATPYPVSVTSKFCLALPAALVGLRPAASSLAALSGMRLAV